MIIDKKYYHERGVIKGVLAFFFSSLSTYAKIILGLNSLKKRLVKESYYKGIPYLREDNQNALICNSCMVCQNICPVGAIQINGAKDNLSGPPKDFNLNLLSCTRCGDCISLCPEKALGNSEVVEYSLLSEESGILTKEVLRSFNKIDEVKEPETKKK